MYFAKVKNSSFILVDFGKLPLSVIEPIGRQLDGMKRKRKKIKKPKYLVYEEHYPDIYSENSQKTFNDKDAEVSSITSDIKDKTVVEAPAVLEKPPIDKFEEQIIETNPENLAEDTIALFFVDDKKGSIPPLLSSQDNRQIRLRERPKSIDSITKSTEGLHSGLQHNNIRKIIHNGLRRLKPDGNHLKYDASGKNSSSATGYTFFVEGTTLSPSRVNFTNPLNSITQNIEFDQNVQIYKTIVPYERNPGFEKKPNNYQISFDEDNIKNNISHPERKKSNRNFRIKSNRTKTLRVGGKTQAKSPDNTYKIMLHYNTKPEPNYPSNGYENKKEAFNIDWSKSFNVKDPKPGDIISNSTPRINVPVNTYSPSNRKDHYHKESYKDIGSKYENIYSSSVSNITDVGKLHRDIESYDRKESALENINSGNRDSNNYEGSHYSLVGNTDYLRPPNTFYGKVNSDQPPHDYQGYSLGYDDNAYNIEIPYLVPNYQKLLHTTSIKNDPTVHNLPFPSLSGNSEIINGYAHAPYINDEGMNSEALLSFYEDQREDSKAYKPKVKAIAQTNSPLEEEYNLDMRFEQHHQTPSAEVEGVYGDRVIDVNIRDKSPYYLSNPYYHISNKKDENLANQGYVLTCDRSHDLAPSNRENEQLKAWNLKENYIYNHSSNQPHVPQPNIGYRNNQNENFHYGTKLNNGFESQVDYYSQKGYDTFPLSIIETTEKAYVTHKKDENDFKLDENNWEVDQKTEDRMKESYQDFSDRK